MINAKIAQFMQNWAKKNRSDSKYNHNVYHLETRDRDGNVTGEAFAINTITVLQMASQFATTRPVNISGIYESPNRLYIGGDYSAPDHLDVSMNSLLCPGIDNSDHTSTSFAEHICYWDNIEETLYFQQYLLEGTLGYEVQGLPDVTEIKEIGISNRGVGGSTNNDANHLSMHADVYDQHGDRSSIIKRKYEKLIIKVYVTIAMKPQFIHNKLKTEPNRQMFAMDPFSYSMMYTSGDAGARSYTCIYGLSYIRYPIDERSSRDNTYHKCIMMAPVSGSAYNNSNRFFTRSEMPVINPDPEAPDYDPKEPGEWDYPEILQQFAAVQTIDPDDPESSTDDIPHSLMENKSHYVDMFILAGNGTTTMSLPVSGGTDGAVYYLNNMALVAPVTNNITADHFGGLILYIDNINENAITNNLGYPVESFVGSPRGWYPFVDLSVSSSKLYNGLTHTWDIDETPDNRNNNDFVLTEYFLFPWVHIRIHTDILGLGDALMGIWFNHWTEHPITSFDRNIEIYATNAWWDPSTWIRVEDCSNVPSNVGSKSYFLTKLSSPSNVGFPPPLVVSRSNIIKPGIQMQQTVTLPNKDQASYTPPTINSATNPVAAGMPMRRHIACDSKGYIWMSNTIYYPDADVSYPIQTSESLSNINQPSPSMRYTEPSGKRILQIFRANNAPPAGTTPALSFSPRLSKVSVFDISDDPTVPPHEYLITMPGTFSDSYTYNGSETIYTYITSTENGHVVFTKDNSTSRVFVVNLLGDANSNYEPYAYILTDPYTSENLSTAYCYAIKYTNYVVYQVNDMEYSSDDDWLFRIQDLTTNTIYQEFYVPKMYMSAETALSTGTIRYIRGWKNFIYIVYTTSSSSMRVFFYNMNDPGEGVRVLTEDIRITRAMMPGGSYYGASIGAKIRQWRYLTEGHTYGDEHCFLLYNVYSTNNADDEKKTPIEIFYVDEDHPEDPVNIGTFDVPFSWSYLYRGVYTKSNGEISSSYDSLWAGIEMNVCTYNQGKQRLLIVNMNGGQYLSNMVARPVYIDLNYVRDNRKYFEHVNSKYMISENYPIDDTYDKNNAGKYCAVMYKGKVMLCEYDTRIDTIGRNATISVIDPNRCMPHYASGSTNTIQAYENPKKVYAVNNTYIRYVNDKNNWDPYSNIPHWDLEVED